MGISLDPTTIREEAYDRLANDITSEGEDLTIIEKLPDELIDELIDDAADDFFWEAFDNVRSAVISRLCRVGEGGEQS